MKKQTKVDRYLRQVERELKSRDPAERGTIMADVRAQIARALTKASSTDEALREMGPAKLTARSYLKADGRPGTEPRSRVLRYVAIGTVAFFATVFAVGLGFILKLSPSASDVKAGGVAWPAAAVRVIEPTGAGRTIAGTPTVIESETQSGTQDLTESKVNKVRIPFNTGKIELKPSATHDLTWTCLASHRQSPKVDVEAGVLTLALDSLNVARCVIGIPADTKVEVRGGNGHLEIKRPGSAVDVQLANGRVSVAPDPQRTYDFDVRVKNGLQDFFRRSANPRAIKVKVNVTNGSVKNE